MGSHCQVMLPPYDRRWNAVIMTMRIATAEWANPAEVEERYPYRDGTVWLGRSASENQVPLGYRDDRHVCLVSGSRGGKGTTSIVNNSDHFGRARSASWIPRAKTPRSQPPAGAGVRPTARASARPSGSRSVQGRPGGRLPAGPVQPARRAGPRQTRKPSTKRGGLPTPSSSSTRAAQRSVLG